MRRNAVAGWVECGGKRFYARSKAEANYARFLEFMRVHGEIAEWEHEPITFWFEDIKRGVRSYLPDYRVTRTDGSQYYVEVKGYMDSKSATKLKRMAKYHPAIELHLVDAKQYAGLKRTVARFVPGWI